MDKFKVDLTESSSFKGIRIFYDYLREGLEYAKKEKIKDVSVWNGTNTDKQLADFDIFKEFDFIENLQFIVPLNTKSNINGLYELKNLKKLHWGVGTNIKLDFSKIESLKILNIGAFHKKAENLNQLKELEELYIQSIDYEKMKEIFSLKGLEKLRVINGSFENIEGIDNCSLLKRLDLVKCNKLINIDDVYHLKKLQSLRIERCKSLTVDITRLNKSIKEVIYI